MEENVNKNKKMMIIIISLLSILLVAVIIISIFFIKVLKNSKSKNDHDESLINTSITETTLISLSEPINTNLLPGPDGRERVISINLSIAVNDETKKSEKIINLIKSSEPVVRDVTIGLLREKTYDELRNINSNNLIKEELLRKLQEEFKTNLIVKVYLSGLYMT